MRDVEQRREHQCAIAVELDRLLWLVGSRVPDTAAAAVVRWHLARAVLVRVQRGAASAGEAQSLDGDAGGDVARLMQAFVVDWPISRMSKEWAEFGEAARVLANSLGHRLALPHSVVPRSGSAERQVAA